MVLRNSEDFYISCFALGLASPEDKVKNEEEGNYHGSDNKICTHPPVARDLLETSGAKLERFGRIADTVAFLFHHIQLVLVFEHAGQVAPHFTCNCVERLLNLVSLSA